VKALQFGQANNICKSFESKDEIENEPNKKVIDCFAVLLDDVFNLLFPSLKMKIKRRTIRLFFHNFSYVY